MTDKQIKDRFLKARREIILRDFARLNEMQREAALAVRGPLLILAGAGSGKTTVLINRIANLLRYGEAGESDELPPGVNEEQLAFLERYISDPKEEDTGHARRLCALRPAAPWSIIAITFTNKAANELKSRLERILGAAGRDVWAATFHSACVRILRRDIDRLGFDKSFTIYDTSDSERVMKEIIKSLNLNDKQFPPRSVLGIISRAKDEMIGPAAFQKTYENGNDFRMARIAQAYELYQRRLKEANALDFDDIILHTVTLLLGFEEVREYYQNKFKYVLIDEYQDTNNLQYLLASTLAGKYKNICVVGDDDQSIYKFRGATLENILSFEKQYKNARVIRLEENYRSTKNILDAANGVIKNNLGRKGKQLWTQNEEGPKILLYSAFNDYEEGEFIADRILKDVEKGASFKDYTILYRMNAQSNRMETAFRQNGVPYRILGGTRFFDRAEVKDMLAYLCLVHNHDDELRLTRVINVPPRGIGAKTVEMVQYLAHRDNTGIFEVLRHAEQYPELAGRAAARLTAFAAMIEELTEIEKREKLSDFYEQVMDRTGYAAALEEKGDEPSKGRLENIRELKSSIISYENDSAENAGAGEDEEVMQDTGLGGFLDQVELFTDIDQYDESADAVVMMTMHSAKGLEFPTVFIIGAEDGLFPGMRSVADPEELEEERRLCYVAITRAKRQLYITCAQERILFGQTMRNPLSRFISEIPEENIQGRPKRKPRQDTWSPELMESRGQENSSARRAPRRASEVFGSSSLQKPVQSGPTVNFRNGDMVEHRAFGRGMVVAVTPMGGDAMMEIVFDGVGTKRLMAKSAARHLKPAR